MPQYIQKIYILGQRVPVARAVITPRLLRSTSNPEERLVLWQMRELWEALAVDGLGQPDLDEQIEALSNAETKLLAQIRPTLH
jgi:hypothetical protein